MRQIAIGLRLVCVLVAGMLTFFAIHWSDGADAGRVIVPVQRIDPAPAYACIINGQLFHGAAACSR